MVNWYSCQILGLPGCSLPRPPTLVPLPVSQILSLLSAVCCPVSRIPGLQSAICIVSEIQVLHSAVCPHISQIRVYMGMVCTTTTTHFSTLQSQKLEFFPLFTG